MILPTLPRQVPRKVRQQLAIRSLNYTDNYRDGELASSNNICPDRYPYIKTIDKLTVYSTPHEENEIHTVIDAYPYEGKLFVITKRSRDGRYCCWHGTAGKWKRVDSETGIVLNNRFPKQYAVVNSKLCIFPDCVMYDVRDAIVVLQALGRPIVWQAEDSVTIEQSGDRMFITFRPSNSIDFRILLKDADGALTVTDCYIEGMLSEADNGRYTLLDVGKRKMTFKTSKPVTTGKTYGKTKVVISEYKTNADGTMVEGTVPALDYVCDQDNRLYGCSNRDKTIYVSALGDPSDFGTYEGVATDSYAVAVGTGGDFTGCVATGSSVLFMKQHHIHKLLGSYPAEYYLYQYDIEGVMEGCSGSLISCEGTALYMSEHGMRSYSGGAANAMIEAIDPAGVTDACTMYDGKSYWLSCSDRIYEYDLQHGVWVQHTDSNAYALAHLGSTSFAAIDGKLYVLNSGEDITADTEWELTFKPFIDTITGTYNSTSEIFEKKRYTRLFIRAELKKGSRIEALIRMDGAGIWQKVGAISGGLNQVETLVMSTPRADKFEIKIIGKGPATILSIEREYQQKESAR